MTENWTFSSVWKFDFCEKTNHLQFKLSCILPGVAVTLCVLGGSWSTKATWNATMKLSFSTMVSLDGSWSCPGNASGSRINHSLHCPDGRQTTFEEAFSKTPLLLNEIRDLYANVPYRPGLHPSWYSIASIASSFLRKLAGVGLKADSLYFVHHPVTTCHTSTQTMVVSTYPPPTKSTVVVVNHTTHTKLPS